MTTNGHTIPPSPKNDTPMGNIDEVVVDGKLFRKEAYEENGCTKFRLIEVK
jgi:hypothetical protein